MKYTLICMMMFLLISCSSTEITSSWKAQNANVSGYKKILVLGIFNDNDRSWTEQIENELTNQIGGLGYETVSALKLYGPKAFENMTEEDIVNKLKSSRFDAVFTTAMLDVSSQETYRPGRVSVQPVGVVYNRFGRYYRTVYDQVYQPGYYTTSTQYFLESNLYDLNSGALKYSVQGKTFNPSSTGSLSKDYGKQLLKDMRKKNVLIKR